MSTSFGGQRYSSVFKARQARADAQLRIQAQNSIMQARSALPSGLVGMPGGRMRGYQTTEQVRTAARIANPPESAKLATQGSAHAQSAAHTTGLASTAHERLAEAYRKASEQASFLEHTVSRPGHRQTEGVRRAMAKAELTSLKRQIRAEEAGLTTLTRSTRATSTGASGSRSRKETAASAATAAQQPAPTTRSSAGSRAQARPTKAATTPHASVLGDGETVYPFSVRRTIGAHESIAVKDLSAHERATLARATAAENVLRKNNPAYRALMDHGEVVVRGPDGKAYVARQIKVRNIPGYDVTPRSGVGEGPFHHVMWSHERAAEAMQQFTPIRAAGGSRASRSVATNSAKTAPETPIPPPPSANAAVRKSWSLLTPTLQHEVRAGLNELSAIGDRVARAHRDFSEEESARTWQLLSRVHEIVYGNPIPTTTPSRASKTASTGVAKTPGGSRAATRARPADTYMGERFHYGGQTQTRAQIIDDLKRQGGTQAMIDRYLQGMELKQGQHGLGG